MLLRGWSRLKEVSLSVPDSAGKQYVERIVYATEEWGMADSTELVSVSANTVNEQGVTSSVSVEQEVTRRKNEPDCLVDINSWFDHFNLSATKIATDKIDTFVCIAL